jgi:hypothetical protein
MSQWSNRNFFGRLLADFANALIQFIPRGRDFSNRFGCVYGDRNDYALYEVTSDGVDTVGIWGSNPHAPTNTLNNLALTTFSRIQAVAPT